MAQVLSAIQLRAFTRRCGLTLKSEAENQLSFHTSHSTHHFPYQDKFKAAIPSVTNYSIKFEIAAAFWIL
jgi:hypothetical protein